MHSSCLLVLTKIDIFLAMLARSFVVSIFQDFSGILHISKYMLSPKQGVDLAS